MGPRTRSLGLDAATVVVVEEAVEEFVMAEYQ